MCRRNIEARCGVVAMRVQISEQSIVCVDLVHKNNNQMTRNLMFSRGFYARRDKGIGGGVDLGTVLNPMWYCDRKVCANERALNCLCRLGRCRCCQMHCCGKTYFCRRSLHRLPCQLCQLCHRRTRQRR